MNYTTNYHLPQWDETDRIMRTDFNQMCADIESGLTRNAADAASANAKTAADAASATSEASSAAAQATQKAQSTADAALAKANAAYSPDQPPYVLGTYTGTGKELSVDLGFKANFIIIGGGSGDRQIAAGRNTPVGTQFHFTETGFTVKPYTVLQNNGETVERPPYLSGSGGKYSYIAFR